MLALLAVTTAFDWLAFATLYSNRMDPQGGPIAQGACIMLTLGSVIAGVAVLALATGELLRDVSAWAVIALIFAGIVCLANMVTGVSLALA